MAEILLALVTGAFVGILFSILKLPLPAPPVISGIAGIAGIYFGGAGYRCIIERFFNNKR
jgi:XapX domain-containing protein